MTHFPSLFRGPLCRDPELEYLGTQMSHAAISAALGGLMLCHLVTSQLLFVHHKKRRVRRTSNQ